MSKVEIYTTRYCPYCISAKALLTRKKIQFTEIDVSGDPAGRAKMVERAEGGMARLVMKFGGTSVADIDRIRNVARHVKREVDAGHEVAVVVSAMTRESPGLFRFGTRRRGRCRRHTGATRSGRWTTL